MANNIINPVMYTMETLRVLENMLVFTKKVNRQYDDRFAVSGAKIGDTINIRRPARFIGTTGTALSIEDYTESSVPLKLDTQFHVDTTFTTADLTLKLDDFSERLIKPVAAAIANKVDLDGLVMAKNTTANQVGTAGTIPATALVLLQAGQKLDEMAAPRDGNRVLILNPAANATLINSMTGFFNSQKRIESQFEEGMFVDATNTLGMQIGMSQNVAVHTVGPLGGTPLVNGASQGLTSGWAATSSLLTKGWTAAAASRLKRGDVFTIAGVFAVNPQSRLSSGALMQFVVEADFSSDGSGNGAVTIRPALITAGAFQNSSASPADSAAITVTGTAGVAYAQSIAFHKDAFALGTADLIEVTSFGAWGARKNYKGISMRVARQYAIATDTVPCRVDVLYGWAPLYADALAVRITS